MNLDLTIYSFGLSAAVNFIWDLSSDFYLVAFQLHQLPMASKRKAVSLETKVAIIRSTEKGRKLVE